ncbi:hypothetical protein BT69DRAFT_1327780 [Atractiella rhizophila]|nr:hypothetical protein BT69DRAFT_1327780 [Atractiella rhizophila]
MEGLAFSTQRSNLTPSPSYNAEGPQVGSHPPPSYHFAPPQRISYPLVITVFRQSTGGRNSHYSLLPGTINPPLPHYGPTTASPFNPLTAPNPPEGGPIYPTPIAHNAYVGVRNVQYSFPQLRSVPSRRYQNISVDSRHSFDTSVYALNGVPTPNETYGAADREFSYTYQNTPMIHPPFFSYPADTLIPSNDVPTPNEAGYVSAGSDANIYSINSVSLS